MKSCKKEKEGLDDGLETTQMHKIRNESVLG